IYSPVKNHTFRISAATAFRSPTFFEFYTETSTEVTVETGLPFPFPPTIDIELPTVGNEDLTPEKITTYEIGYQTFLMERVKARVDLFYNQYKDFINARAGAWYLPNEVFPGSPAGPKYYTYLNRGESEGRGGEISVDVLITEWLTGMVNYSYQEIIDLEDDILTFEDEKDQRRKESPLNKVNAELRAKLKNGVSLNVNVNYVDEVELWSYHKLDPYTLVNVRLGYQINDNLEIAVAAFNLFEDEHYQYTPGNIPGLVFGEEIGRKVTGNVNYKF
ncbi:TonB-dependent receptor, partial [bacterium]|nr:TonB-dependent receptor [bacterium]